MNSRGGLALESTSVGGSVILPYKSKSQILLFNGEKSGSMAIYDLKINKVLS